VSSGLAGSVGAVGHPVLVRPGWDTPVGDAWEWLRRQRLLGWEIPEISARVFLSVLFTLLSVRLVVNFLQTGRITGLLLLVSEGLVVVLTVIRRNAVEVDRSTLTRLVAGVSIAGPPLLRPLGGAGGAVDLMTGMLSALGLVIVVAAKISLGRSFALMPSNRGIVCSGLYRAIRHPIYFGYLVTHVAFLISNPSAWNVSVILAADVALLLRSISEERTLARDPRYVEYCAAVRWRLLPGVF
jgi:hypothetical protein